MSKKEFKSTVGRLYKKGG
ncbi:MAG: hypothetical protein PF482_06885 [Desulfobacteraceae bacterium]|nr:hypothetical protein [Desulfobacteraceae bacterium]